MTGFSLRRLAPADAAAYRSFMLEAYARHPEAFTSSEAERAALPMAWWQARLDADPGAATLVVGAYVQERLAGVAGLSFESGEKIRHKARLFGMGVAADCRGRGLGGALVQGLLEHARARDGVRLVQLTVTQGNDAAQRLYARHGFVAFGREPMAIAVGGQYFAKLHMWCELVPVAT